MSFEEQITALSQKLPKLLKHLETEEATKNALVLPFIAALGYDVFNPTEVVPEFVADVGTKKGEKVDYAIMNEGETIALIECKKAGTDLAQAQMSQLFRYFAVTKTRIGILTNGVQYRFFSDLEAPNKMDNVPFLELNLEDLRPIALNEARKLGKENFDLERMLSAANQLKYTAAIKKVLHTQFEDPEEEFVKFFFKRTNPGELFHANKKTQFTQLAKQAFRQFVGERVSDQLRSALENQDKQKESEDQIEEEPRADGIVTTEEELEGYRIVRAIACQQINPERVVHRDTKSYMGILLDDNNRKPLCRLWFNSAQKHLGVFDGTKNETRIPIDGLSDIYKHSDKLLEAIQNYEKEK